MRVSSPYFAIPAMQAGLHRNTGIAQPSLQTADSFQRNVRFGSERQQKEEKLLHQRMTLEDKAKPLTDEAKRLKAKYEAAKALRQELWEDGYGSDANDMAEGLNATKKDLKRATQAARQAEMAASSAKHQHISTVLRGMR